MLWFPEGSRDWKNQSVPIGSVNLSLFHKILTKSLFSPKYGLQSKLLPLLIKSEHAKSQSPDPVDWKSNISPDSAVKPLIGCEINATGGEFNTSNSNE